MAADEARRRARRIEGLTVVEAAVVVCFVGVILAVFVPTFVAELSTSKLTEAPDRLAELHRRAASYYAARRRTEDGLLRHCLPPKAGPTPLLPSADPVTTAFDAEDSRGAATWAALGFLPSEAMRFSYAFLPRQTGCGLRSSADGQAILVLRAEGDLDGDGRRSVFERRARVDDRGELVPMGILEVRDRVE